MVYQYFKPAPATQEEAKAMYHKLALANHPDVGGTLVVMQAINAEYAAILAEFAQVGAEQRQSEAHANGRTSAADYHDIGTVANTLRQKIEFALNLGLDVELCGLWVWVGGDTKPVKDQLSAQDFKWAAGKTKWYFAGVPSLNRRGNRWSMDTIRSTYGSVKFERREEERQPVAAALHA